MSKKIVLLVAVFVVITIIAFVSQSAPKQSTSNLPTIVTVDGMVSTTTTGSNPISVDFTSNNQPSTFPIKGGFYSAQLSNQHSYSITVKYSLKIMGNTTIVPPPANCGTLQLNATRDTYHYDIAC